MRKTLISVARNEAGRQPEHGWLNLDSIARVEVTSEQPNFPVEGALTPEGTGWRAAQPGQQILRLIFDQPISLSRIRVEFSETDRERTQEFTLRAMQAPTGPFREIVRQQWNFSPDGATTEVEDYAVTLTDVSILELILRPDLTSNQAPATLARLQLA